MKFLFINGKTRKSTAIKYKIIGKTIGQSIDFFQLLIPQKTLSYLKVVQFYAFQYLYLKIQIFKYIYFVTIIVFSIYQETIS